MGYYLTFSINWYVDFLFLSYFEGIFNELVAEINQSFIITRVIQPSRQFNYLFKVSKITLEQCPIGHFSNVILLTLPEL